jgi:hypothetical protein
MGQEITEYIEIFYNRQLVALGFSCPLLISDINDRSIIYFRF